MDSLSSIEDNGYAIIHGVFNDSELDSIILQLNESLKNSDARSMKSRDGTVYAARNIFDVFPLSKTFWIKPQLCDVLEQTLGTEYGIVRGLYFDKPPDRSWSLPWHKDMTIAVQNNSHSSTLFRNPTRKSGIDHVEAPDSILTNMLTLRIHLDDVTDENGPLQVIPGSHRSHVPTSLPETPSTAIKLSAGDVLAMRPLISHCSGNSVVGTTRHRRVIHLEFAASPVLPDGFQWKYYLTPHRQAAI